MNRRMILDRRTSWAPGDPDADRADARDEVWFNFWLEIEDLLATGQYTWAEPALRGIQATVEDTQRVTMKQVRAVDHIRRARRDGRFRDYRD